VGTGGTVARPAILFRDRRAFLFGSAVARFGIETRRRGLEEITTVELRKALEAR
jgi:hypothetical protein